MAKVLSVAGWVALCVGLGLFSGPALVQMVVNIVRFGPMSLVPGEPGHDLGTGILPFMLCGMIACLMGMGMVDIGWRLRVRAHRQAKK